MLKKLLAFIRNKYFLMVLRLAVAAFFLWWVMKDIRFSELRKLTWRGIVFSLAAAGVLELAQIVGTVLRWCMLLRGQGIRIPLRRALSLTFQGCMFSLFMPGGAVGGDVLKAAFLTRETKDGHKIEGVTTIFLDRVIGMMGLFLLVLVFGGCCLPSILTFAPKIRLLVWVLLAVCLAGFCAGLALLFQDFFFRIRLFAFLLRKADALVHGALTRILNSVEVCRRDRRTLLVAFLLSFLVLHPLLIFVAFMVMIGLTGSFPPFLSGFFSVACGSTASVAPVTPGGLGTRDKVIEVLLESFGFEPSIASLTPILYSMVLLLPAFIGIVCFLLDMKGSPGPDASPDGE
ncbi:MAG: flippase-like domain-containing protein [Lentisphaeria bacterium]|nr:flippase-like domain-containing protein [Lentisphaeria bacterium]